MTLNIYSGKTDIHAHPSVIPGNWDEFAVKREGDHDTILDIRPWVRRNVCGQPKGLYYICVKGLLSSTYTMKVSEF